MPRIIAGAAGGRRLLVPTGRGTRPTSDRAREALFSTLATMIDLRGARVLDLYAGSGALGLEALSRGAVGALLVEDDPRTARVIGRNIEALGLPGARLVVDHVTRLLSRPADAAYDVVVADPPYSLSGRELTEMLGALVAGGWLAAGAVLAVERPSRGAPLRWPPGIEAVKTRRYGEGALWYGRAS